MSPEVQALLGRASQLFRAGRHAEALPAYQRLLAREPRLPDSWFNLAMLQRGARQPLDALASYQRALDLGIRGPEEVHLQRGVIYSDDLGDSDAARAELDAALRIAPGYRPALLNLGNLQEDLGAFDAARESYSRVLSLHPDDPLALSRLAGLAPIGQPDDPLLQQIRVLLSRPALSLLDRADLGFALGVALDRIGAYDAAFAAYGDANCASRAMAAAGGVRYDRQAQEDLVDRLIAAFPAAVDRPAAAEADAPIFICGMFRSGSTLAEQVLVRNADVVAGGELDALPALVRTSQPYPEAIAAATPPRLAELRAAYLREIAPRRVAGAALTDKRPDNFLHIGLIKALFPHARIVHTVRERRDNCLSVYFLHAAADLAYATDLGDIGHFHDQHNRLMAHWRRLYPDDILDLDYDRLVADPADVIAGLLAFCGLPARSPAQASRASATPVRTASNWQVRQPLYRTSSGRWRHYEQHLAPLLDSASAPAP